MEAERGQSRVLAAVSFLVIAFLLLPVLVVVLAAFSKTSYLTIPPQGLTLHWFEVVLTDSEYLGSFRLADIIFPGTDRIFLYTDVVFIQCFSEILLLQFIQLPVPCNNFSKRVHNVTSFQSNQSLLLSILYIKQASKSNTKYNIIVLHETYFT